jgi:hypothetical protein
MEGGGQKGSRTCFVGCFEFLEVPAPAPVVSLWVEFSRPSRGTRVRRSTRHQRTFRLGLPDLPATQLQPSSENVRWVLGELWASIASRRDGGTAGRLLSPVACRQAGYAILALPRLSQLQGSRATRHVDSRGFPSGPVMHVAQFHPSAAAARRPRCCHTVVPCSCMGACLVRGTSQRRHPHLHEHHVAIQHARRIDWFIFSFSHIYPWPSWKGAVRRPTSTTIIIHVVLRR